MLFASDLDQTLIYSERSKGSISLDDMVPVELFQGRHISYMTRAAAARLRELNELAPFVPVTARTPEQYHRIFAFREWVIPEYVIVSNGGNVLINGEIDQEWDSLVRQAVREGCSEQGEIQEMFQRIADDSWVQSSTLCDGLFYSIVVERDKLPAEKIDSFRKELAAHGWSYSLQGRKIYLVPEQVSKGAALVYVKEKLGESRVLAAGDSLLDESLLLAADTAFAPSHGELKRQYNEHSHIVFTRRTGAEAAEEILEACLDVARSQFSC
ncbi:HAD family hydrolase [Paenibacillus tarimensis]|uniref:HAD family hydrolase n=1 Tax=Paenibacillus tarimensis TaxID=416012 RepID=UPI001F3EC48D|nr:HAD family hydrolase [Paenibacillus tarimensis]MCF2944594.1 hydrolase [Paenibacillus tarimensis]